MGENSNEVLAQASRRQQSLAREMLHFLGHTKKWWLAPILLFVLLLGSLSILGSTGAGPFLYTLF